MIGRADAGGKRRLWVLAIAVLLAPWSAPSPLPAQEPTFWTRDNLTGDWGGFRTKLTNRGIDFSATYVGETFTNTSGGLQRGTTYEDLISFGLDTDLEKFMGWKGGSFHVSAYQIDDNGENAVDLTGSISDPSSIDAVPTFRLFSLWLEQGLGRVGSARIGQIAADDEFFISNTASNLINSTFGWPNITAVTMPGGGPAYPLATPGVRLELDPTENTKTLWAAFSGDPAGDCPPGQNPQICNRHGTTFSFSGGTLFMGELQYLRNQGDKAVGLKATYKLGGWYHNGEFADQEFGVENDGAIVSLALNPPHPLDHRGDWGIYGIVDQTVWQGKVSSVSLFWRGGVVPPDRNLLSWYMDGGIGIAAPFQSRPNDVITFGVAYSNISEDAAALDRATSIISGTPFPIRNQETVFELNYAAQLAPWWTLKPDLQYIVNPGGNVPNPNSPSRTIEDAFLVALRTIVVF